MAGGIGGTVFDRHRKWTLIALGILMIASTSLVSNQRALFRPMGTGLVLDAAVPQAYAMVVPGTKGRLVSRSGRGSGGDDTSPRAFGLRLPPVLTTTDQSPFQSTVMPAPDMAGVDGAADIAPIASDFPGANLIGFPGAGYGDPGAGGGGGPIGGTTPAVPEPASWVIMLFGIGAIGAVIRRASRSSKVPRSGHLSDV